MVLLPWISPALRRRGVDGHDQGAERSGSGPTSLGIDTNHGGIQFLPQSPRPPWWAAPQRGYRRDRGGSGPPEPMAGMDIPTPAPSSRGAARRCIEHSGASNGNPYVLCWAMAIPACPTRTPPPGTNTASGQLIGVDPIMGNADWISCTITVDGRYSYSDRQSRRRHRCQLLADGEPMKKLMAATALGGAIIGSLLGASSASAEPSVGYDGQPSESAFCADLDLKKPAMVT